MSLFSANENDNQSQNVQRSHYLSRYVLNFVIRLGEPHQNVPLGYASVPSAPWDPQGDRELGKISTPCLVNHMPPSYFFSLCTQSQQGKLFWIWLSHSDWQGTRHSLDVRRDMISRWSYMNFPPFFLNNCNNSRCWGCLLLTLFILYC
jgi:hypothetical protein